YYKERRERDIVHLPGGAKEKPKEKEASDKKEPYKDRVLDKALEHLRGQKKADAGRVQFENAQRPELPATQLPALTTWTWSQTAAQMADAARSRFRTVWA